jgi:translation initiation factor IF-3
MLTNLRTKILTEKVPVLYIALDQDALKDVTKELEYFMNNGIDVRYVKLSDKDPSELGFHNTTEQINKTQQADLLDLIHLKLNFN